MNEVFRHDIQFVPPIFPSLLVEIRDEIEILAGELSIIDAGGKEWDRYQIEIHESQDYPYKFPLLYETGGRIPRIPDWHVYSDTGSCCIDITPSEIFHCKKGLNVTEYIPRFVIPYFANQTHRFREGYYKNGEYSHGGKGLLEYYLPILKTNDPHQAIQWLELFCRGAYNSKIIFSRCFCGSGKKFGNCHKEAIVLLQGIGAAEVKKNMLNIMHFLKSGVK